MRRRILIAIVVVALALVAVVTRQATAAGRVTTVSAMFTSTVGLYPGSDVQVLGVPVGTVTSVVPSGEGVKVTMRLDDDESVAADTDAVIVAPTLVSDRFVQLTKPWTGGAKLASGTTLSTDRTAVPVEIDDLYRSLTGISDALGPKGANRNGALSEFLDVASRNLQGQGAGINRTIRDFGKASDTLADSSDDLFATIANVKQFNDMLLENDRSVADVNRQFAAVTDYLADDSDDLAGAIDNLGEALAIVDDFIRDNRGHLTSSVQNLEGPTRVLVNQRASLEESVRLAPLVLQNFLRAYNPDLRTIEGRGNLNELSLWGTSAQGDAGRSTDPSSSSRSALPPALLPGVDR